MLNKKDICFSVELVVDFCLIECLSPLAVLVLAFCKIPDNGSVNTVGIVWVFPHNNTITKVWVQFWVFQCAINSPDLDPHPWSLCFAVLPTPFPKNQPVLDQLESADQDAVGLLQPVTSPWHSVRSALIHRLFAVTVRGAFWMAFVEVFPFPALSFYFTGLESQRSGDKVCWELRERGQSTSSLGF